MGIAVPSFDKQAAGYDARWKSYLRCTHAMALGLLRPQPGDVILDAAGGTGALAMDLAQLVGQRGQVVVADTSEGMLAVARRRLAGLPNVRVVQEDLSASGFPAEYFSKIVCANAFHYCREPEAAFAGFERVLKWGGCVALVDWCRDQWRGRLLDYLMPLFDKSHVRAYGQVELVRLAEGAGFAVTDVAHSNHGPWGLVGLAAEKMPPH